MLDPTSEYECNSHPSTIFVRQSSVLASLKKRLYAVPAGSAVKSSVKSIQVQNVLKHRHKLALSRELMIRFEYGSVYTKLSLFFILFSPPMTLNVVVTHPCHLQPYIINTTRTIVTNKPQ